MTTETLRAAIEAALTRRFGFAAVMMVYESEARSARARQAVVSGAYSPGSLCASTIRGTDEEALRDLACLVGLRITDAGEVVDPAEEVHRLRAELAETERRLNAEISAMDARDGAYQALDGARDGSDDLVALAECRMAEIGRLRAELALERERCVALVREIPACQPGAKATAARRWLDDRVAACVRAIEVDDETATCARSLVREARERAKAAEADLVRARAELDATREALRAHLFCDECEELATRCHAESASFGCDAHGVGDGWADTTHAAAVRAAGGVR